MDSGPTEAAVPAPSGTPKPATVQQCHVVIETLAAQIAVLQEQVALLQERVSLNSRNSSKPPSSDGPGSGNRLQRRASGRKRGAQKGHPGSFRALLDADQVDAVHDCPPPPSCECGGAVSAVGKPLRHQVFDLPAQIRPDVQEYRLYSGVCASCRRVHQAALPAGVPRGQIGPRALALVGLLGTHYHLTQFKIRDLLAQLMGVNFSVGAISAAHGLVAQALGAPVRLAANTLSQAPVLNTDETRYPREGSLNWVWTVVQPKLVVFSVLPSRARYVLTSLIGEQPAGIVGSDRYAAYAHLNTQQRQLCWAHLLRDFERIAQRNGMSGRIGRRLLGLGRLMFRWRAQDEPIERYAGIQRRVRQALQRGAAQSRCSRTANTCANILKSWAALWTFLDHPEVEPTNNAAEQALRAIVLKRKISGPTRSRRGDDFIARGYTAMLSCQRQGRDLLDYLHHAVLAWIDKTAPPSLLPAAPACP